MKYLQLKVILGHLVSCCLKLLLQMQFHTQPFTISILRSKWNQVTAWCSAYTWNNAKILEPISIAKINWWTKPIRILWEKNQVQKLQWSKSLLLCSIAGKWSRSQAKKNWWWMIDQWNVLGLFPTGSIVRGSHHWKFLTCRKQDLNMYRTWVQP